MHSQGEMHENDRDVLRVVRSDILQRGVESAAEWTFEISKLDDLDLSRPLKY